MLSVSTSSKMPIDDVPVWTSTPTEMVQICNEKLCTHVHSASCIYTAVSLTGADAFVDVYV